VSHGQSLLANYTGPTGVAPSPLQNNYILWALILAVVVTVSLVIRAVWQRRRKGDYSRINDTDQDNGNGSYSPNERHLSISV
jgi:hypothetical protein